MHPRTRTAKSSWLLALSLLTGCNLSVDTSLIRSLDAGADAAVMEEEDVEWEDARDAPPEKEGSESGTEPRRDAEVSERDAEVMRDASVELDAQPPVLDASVDAQVTWPPTRDAEVRDAQERDGEGLIIDRCGGDNECAAGSFCAASGGCVARCDAQHGCAGPAVPRGTENFAAAGDMIYWSTPVETDSLGNALNHGRIWSWRRTDPWNAVEQRDTGTLLFVIDGYIYLRRPASLGAEATVLMRKWLGTPNAPAEQLATNVRKVWKTRDHVVWSRTEAANEELWRLRRMPGSAPARALVTSEGHWTSSNTTYAVRYVSPSPATASQLPRFVIVRLADQAVHGVVEQDAYGSNENSAADEDYFYFPDSAYIKRAPFSDLSQRLNLAVGFMHFSLRCEASGGWLYWYGEDGSGVDGGRTQRDALGAPQRLPTAPPYAAVIKNELVYSESVGENEQRIYIMTMPPLSCSSAIPCPEDMTCGANMLCE